MEKINIRALILDYGGVISQPQNPENVNNILQSLHQDYDDFMQVYYDHRVGYDSGLLSGQEYWVRVLQHYGLDPNGFNLSRFIQEDVNSWTHLNESMLQYLIESRDRIHKLAMISNMAEDTLFIIRRHYDWLDLFDELIFSCEVGVNKPEREIYEICLRKLGIRPHECLFVDDSVINVEGAIDSGMRAIQFKSFSQFLHDLEENFLITP